jgi:hypothetical protein
VPPWSNNNLEGSNESSAKRDRHVTSRPKKPWKPRWCLDVIKSPLIESSPPRITLLSNLLATISILPYSNLLQQYRSFLIGIYCNNIDPSLFESTVTISMLPYSKLLSTASILAASDWPNMSPKQTKFYMPYMPTNERLPPMTSKQARATHRKKHQWRVGPEEYARRRREREEEEREEQRTLEREHRRRRKASKREKENEKSRREKKERQRAGIPEPSRHVRASQQRITCFTTLAGKGCFNRRPEEDGGQGRSSKDCTKSPTTDDAQEGTDDEFGPFPTMSQAEILFASVDELSCKPPGEGRCPLRGQGSGQDVSWVGLDDAPEGGIGAPHPDSGSPLPVCSSDGTRGNTKKASAVALHSKAPAWHKGGVRRRKPTWPSQEVSTCRSQSMGPTEGPSWTGTTSVADDYRDCKRSTPRSEQRHVHTPPQPGLHSGLSGGAMTPSQESRQLLLDVEDLPSNTQIAIEMEAH